MPNLSTVNTFQLLHHGAARGVTGSCHELQLGRDSLLIDCGQFQGEAGSARLDVSLARVRAVLLTHVTVHQPPVDSQI